jgi:hypothetical protein
VAQDAVLRYTLCEHSIKSEFYRMMCIFWPAEQL